MPSTFNILSAANQLTVRNDSGVMVSVDDISYDWTVTGGLISVVDDFIHNINYYALKVTPSTTEPVVLSLSNVLVDGADHQDGTLLFHVAVNAGRSVSVTNKINRSDIPGELLEVKTTIVDIDSTTTCRSNQYRFPDDDTSLNFDITITISNHNAEVFYLTQFCFVNDDHFYRNPIVRQARTYIPEIYWTIDRQQTDPRYPMFKLFDAMTWAAGDTSQLYSNFFDFEKTELDAENEFDVDTSWQESTLVSAEYHDSAFREWLFQFIGARLKKNVSFNSGSFFTTQGDIEAYILWQLQTAYYGYNAGTLAAIKASVQQVLTGTKYVGVTFTTDWEFEISTYISETPADLDMSNSSPAVLDAVAPAKAMGFKITHLAISPGANIFTLNSPTLGKLDSANVLGS